MTTRALLRVAVALIVGSAVAAQDVALTEGQADVSITLNGQQIIISRTQDTGAILTGEFAKTSRPCPAFCIQPVIPAAGVTPAGELEVIDFLGGNVANNTGLLIDARVPDWFNKGAIPGAVNVPFATLGSKNPYQADILRALGAVPINDGFDFSNALTLMIYGNGPWDAQGTHAVQALIAAGYPPALIQNYRGGLEDWLHLGLTTVLP
ncbi:MAG: rhodanese-like domain-containing protein [Yoonia sp.]|nr:rhodanese-like domain-containing protein [Yoonia sp.]